MIFEQIQQWMDANPNLATGAVIAASFLAFFVARFIIARGLMAIASRTKNRYDDVIVEALHPFRIAYLAPLYIFYIFADLFPLAKNTIEDLVLLVTIWVVAATLNSLLNGVNNIYESRATFSGVSIQGYLDIVKLLLILVAIILSISLLTDQSPLLLLSGLGAITAVLLLVFRDTLLSLVASVQITTAQLVKERDWIEVPEYHADGDVINMTLHSVIVRNWDMTITVIPTYKLLETPYKNWRGMSESGGRRIKRALNIDITSIRYLQPQDIEDLKRIALITDYLEAKEKELNEHNARLSIDSNVLVNRRRLTNVGTFRAYVEAYLRRHPDLHQETMTLIVRQLEPSPQGLPIELYAFTKTTVWQEFEAIQADIFDHLIAAVPEFGLRIFQNPSGGDFAGILSSGGQLRAEPTDFS